MKKMLVICISLIISIFIASCSNSDGGISKEEFEELSMKLDKIAEQHSLIEKKLDDYASKEKIDELEQQFMELSEDIVQLRTILERVNAEVIDDKEAIEIAKVISTNRTENWDAKFHEDFDLVPEDEHMKPRDTWEVTATYQFGNKQIFYIDAISGEVYNIVETEPPDTDQQ